MLRFRAHTGLAVLGLTNLCLGPTFRQLGDAAWLGCNLPLQIFAIHLQCSAPLAGLGPDLFCLVMQQVGHLVDLRLVGRRSGHHEHQPVRVPQYGNH